MLRDDFAQESAPAPGDVVLTCGNPDCQHTYEPSAAAVAARALACPRCDGWTFQARLDEPAPAGGERLLGERTEPTPAQEQADVFTALAEHLRANPDLAVVHDVHRSGDRWAFQVMTGLHRWARSIGAETLRAQQTASTRTSTLVTATGVLGGVDVEIRAVIEGMALPYDWTRPVGEATSLALAELEHFAEHGALPAVGGGR